MSVVKTMKEGVIIWNDFTSQADILNAKINTDKKIITIDTKETSDAFGFSIFLKSDDGHSYEGRYDSIKSQDDNGSLTSKNLKMRYYKNQNKHVLVGKWPERGENYLCIIELKE